jgi:suppressor of tumorigenicity protein 13
VTRERNRFLVRWLAVPVMASALTLGCSDKDDEAASASRDRIDAGGPGDPGDGGTGSHMDGGPCGTSDAGGPVVDAGPYPPPLPDEYPPDAGGYPSDAGGYPSDAGGYPSDAGGYPSDAGGNPSDAGGYPSDASFDRTSGTR